MEMERSARMTMPVQDAAAMMSLFDKIDAAMPNPGKKRT
jgi:hypothetical protein